jgi:hypothetical protein
MSILRRAASWRSWCRCEATAPRLYTFPVWRADIVPVLMKSTTLRSAAWHDTYTCNMGKYATSMIHPVSGGVGLIGRVGWDVPLKPPKRAPCDALQFWLAGDWFRGQSYACLAQLTSHRTPSQIQRQSCPRCSLPSISSRSLARPCLALSSCTKCVHISLLGGPPLASSGSSAKSATLSLWPLPCALQTRLEAAVRR